MRCKVVWTLPWFQSSLNSRALNQELPSIVTQPSKPNSRSNLKSIAWAEGLRGLAALGVLSNHLTLCYANFLFRPCCNPNVEDSKAPHLFQLPIFRLVAAGEAFVAMFLVLTGLTTSHKALRHSRAGEPEKAYTSIAASSFRRLPKLFFPATLATLFSWAVCNLGGYEVARSGDAWWMVALTPTMSFGPWYQVFLDGWWAIWVAWEPYGVDPYDQPQWALQFFVEAGMMVFLAILGTSRLSTWWRVAVLAVWGWWSTRLSVAIRDPYVGFCVLYGMILTEFNISPRSKSLSPRIANTLGLSVAFIGLLIMSYPRDVPEVASWSNALVELGQEILPYNDNKYKIWVAIGSLVLTLGTIISPFAQWILGLPSLVWLGKISFPLYLLHGTFIRSLFAWVLFWGQTLGPSLYDENMQRYPLPSAGWIAFSVVCLMVPLLLACHFWVKYFEPFFDKIIMRVEKFMVRKADEQERSQSHRRGYLSRLRAIWRGVALVVKHGGLPDATATPDSLDLDDYETSGLLHEMQECSPIPLGPEEDALFDGFETTPLDGHDTGAPSAVDGNKIEHSSTSF